MSGVDAETRKAGLDRMRAYIATLQPMMRLQQWKITIEEETTEDPDYVATINRTASSWSAFIRFGDVHFGHSVEEQRLTVVHELTHIHLMAFDTAASDGRNTLDPTSRQWAYERVRYELEMATDALSRVLAPLLPLPPSDQRQILPELSPPGGTFTFDHLTNGQSEE